MLFKVTFNDDEDRVDWVQAKSQFDLIQHYDLETNDDIHNIKEVTEISEEESKTIMLTNTSWDEDEPDDQPKELSLFDMNIGIDFCIIGSTEYL